MFDIGKKINRVACGSAHSLAWSTNKPVNTGRLPTQVPMEYNHLQVVTIPILRNRLVLLHHFSDLFCPSIPMFDFEQLVEEREVAGSHYGPDSLRGVLVSVAKVGIFLKPFCNNKPLEKPDRHLQTVSGSNW